MTLHPTVDWRPAVAPRSVPLCHAADQKSNARGSQASCGRADAVRVAETGLASTYGAPSPHAPMAENGAARCRVVDLTAIDADAGTVEQCDERTWKESP